jgi:DNA end-binding protein Ku
MTSRAIWKGIIRLGDAEVPVKLYSAVEERSVHFRLLHAADQTPVRQEMVHPETDEVVPAAMVRHGFETEDGRMVILTAEELQGFAPESSRQIDIICFLPGGAVDHRWYERPYLLGPDEDREAFAAFAAALDGSGTEGLARWVMRGKDYFGILRLQHRYPVLITLRHAEEVVPVAALQVPAGREIDPREYAMAEQLVAALADTFTPDAYRDEYRQRVMQLLRAKASGKVIPLRRAAAKKTTQDLKKALEASLRAARGRRHG